MTDNNKVRENRIRRATQRQCLILVKSRTRDPLADAYGRYVLVPDSAGNRLNGGGQAALRAFRMAMASHSMPSRLS
jgi:hypothetical protein